MNSQYFNSPIWEVENRLCCDCEILSQVYGYSTTVSTPPASSRSISVLSENGVAIYCELAIQVSVSAANSWLMCWRRSWIKGTFVGTIRGFSAWRLKVLKAISGFEASASAWWAACWMLDILALRCLWCLPAARAIQSISNLGTCPGHIGISCWWVTGIVACIPCGCVGSRVCFVVLCTLSAVPVLSWVPLWWTAAPLKMVHVRTYACVFSMLGVLWWDCALSLLPGSACHMCKLSQWEMSLNILCVLSLVNILLKLDTRKAQQNKMWISTKLRKAFSG